MNIQQAANAIENNPEFAHKANESLDAVLRRSQTDMAFRQQLVSNPREALSAFRGSPVTDEVSIAFVEPKAALTFVLPDFVQSAEGSLSDEELETVSGGTTPLCAVCAIAAAKGVTMGTIGCAVGALILVADAIID